VAYHLLNSLATSSFEWYKGSSNTLIVALFTPVFTSRNVPLVAELKCVELLREVVATTLAAYEHGALHEEGLYTKEARRARPKYSTKALGYTALVALVLAALNLIV